MLVNLKEMIGYPQDLTINTKNIESVMVQEEKKVKKVILGMTSGICINIEIGDGKNDKEEAAFIADLKNLMDK